MDAEEAALRAKIQAMRNLLVAKQQQQQRSQPLAAAQLRKPTASVYTPQQQPPHWNRSWSAAKHSTNNRPQAPSLPTALGNANRVWVNSHGSNKRAQDSAITSRPPPVVTTATTGTTPSTMAPTSVTPAGSPYHRHTPATRALNRMQLQRIQLNDGDYSKVNGGFTLVRTGAERTPLQSLAPKNTATAGDTKEIAGMQYKVARGGRSLRRLSASSSSNMSARDKAIRTLVKRARRSSGLVRTEYCRFFNRFGKCGAKFAPGPSPSHAQAFSVAGYCNNKIQCKFIHDSRRIQLCRKFAKGVCTDAGCKLSHDKNKMPACRMFLRGACTRDDCRFRHVKVSDTAPLCEAFLSGYCPQAATCKLRHELPPPPSKKRSTTVVNDTASPHSPSSRKRLVASTGPGAKGHRDDAGTSPADTGTSNRSSGSGSRSDEAPMPLSIRPNIRFAPRTPGLLLPRPPTATSYS